MAEAVGQAVGNLLAINVPLVQTGGSQARGGTRMHGDYDTTGMERGLPMAAIPHIELTPEEEEMFATELGAALVFCPENIASGGGLYKLHPDNKPGEPKN